MQPTECTGMMFNTMHLRPVLIYIDEAVCLCDVAMPNGHIVAETVAMTTKRLDAERLQAVRAAHIEQMRREMEEERERRRVIIAEVGSFLIIIIIIIIISSLVSTYNSENSRHYKVSDKSQS